MYTRKPLPKIKSKGLIIKLFLVMACYTPPLEKDMKGKKKRKCHYPSPDPSQL